MQRESVSWHVDAVGERGRQSPGWKKAANISDALLMRRSVMQAILGRATSRSEMPAGGWKREGVMTRERLEESMRLNSEWAATSSRWRMNAARVLRWPQGRYWRSLCTRGMVSSPWFEESSPSSIRIPAEGMISGSSLKYRFTREAMVDMLNSLRSIEVPRNRESLNALMRVFISPVDPGFLYIPSKVRPLSSISAMHLQTISGIDLFSIQRVTVRGAPKTLSLSLKTPESRWEPGMAAVLRLFLLMLSMKPVLPKPWGDISDLCACIECLSCRDGVERTVGDGSSGSLPDLLLSSWGFACVEAQALQMVGDLN